MAGVDLQLDVLKSVGLIGIGYVVFRVIGKILGASLGAKMTKAPDVVQKHLGYTLIPQRRCCNRAFNVGRISSTGNGR